jgi:hypothetical protein
LSKTDGTLSKTDGTFAQSDGTLSKSAVCFGSFRVKNGEPDGTFAKYSRAKK